MSNPFNPKDDDPFADIPFDDDPFGNQQFQRLDDIPPPQATRQPVRDPRAAKAQRRKKDDGEKMIAWIVVGLVVVVGLIVLVGVVGSLAGDAVGARQLESDYGSAVAKFCEGVPANEAPSLSYAPFAAKPWGTVVIDGDRLHGWHDQLPPEARASRGSEVVVIMCELDSGAATVESCPYIESDGGEFNVRRRQRYVDFGVYNPENGRKVMDVRVWGSAPDPCPYSYFGSGTITGGKVTDTDFYRQAVPYIWQ